MKTLEVVGTKTMQVYGGPIVPLITKEEGTF